MTAPRPLSPTPGGDEAIEVSVLFDDPGSVDSALAALDGMGVPRDLVEVVVAPQAAQRFYRRVVRSPGRETLRYAGIGGLTGLVLGALIALVSIWLGGLAEPGIGAIAQLLGPNVATVVGAMLGALVGAFVRRTPLPRHARAADAPEAIVVITLSRTEEEASVIARLLAQFGAREPRFIQR